MSAFRTSGPRSILDARERTSDERGGLIVALGVLIVVALLSAAVVARTLAGLRSGRQGQDFSAALANADAGVSDALFRMDQSANAAVATFCVGNSPGCTLQAVPGAPGVQYLATRVDDTTYLVESKGLVNGQPHAVKATVTSAYEYPFAIFAKTNLAFNGNSGDYNANTCAGPVETVNSAGIVACNPNGDVATNGQVSCQGSDSPAHQQGFYQGGGTSCQNGKLLPGSYNPRDPTLTCPAPVNVPTTPCLPAAHIPCPAVNGVLPAILAPGAYYCTQIDLGGGNNPSLAFPATGFAVGAGTQNNGQVAIYVIPTDNTNITVSIADTCGWDNGSSSCTSGINYNGDPTKLAVYLKGGTVDSGNGISHSGSYTGIMWAPNAAEANPSCNATWRGTLVVNVFTCNGGPHLDVKYDTRMRSLKQAGWTVTNYTEIPSNQVVLP